MAAAIGVNLPVPLNGSAYSWSRFSISGPGHRQPQPAAAERHRVAAVRRWYGVPRTQDGVLLGSFYNGSGGNLTGQINAFSQVNSNGFYPGRAEPRDHAMLLAAWACSPPWRRRRSRRD